VAHADIKKTKPIENSSQGNPNAVPGSVKIVQRQGDENNTYANAHALDGK
jgi:hypothetical protein